VPNRRACELADAQAVHGLLAGSEAVVHLGGVSVEGPFEPILQANIVGLHNLCFGGAKNNRLFMAASHSLYALHVNTRGAV
jgi:uronate dehydrogenase